MKKTVVLILLFTVILVPVCKGENLPGILSSGLEITDTQSALTTNELVLDALNAQNVFSYFYESVKSGFYSLRRTLAVITAVLFISALISVFEKNLSSGGDLLIFSSMLSAVLLTLDVIKPIYTSIVNYVSSYSAFLTAMSGAMVLSESFTRPVSSAAGAASCAFIVSLIQQLSVNIIIPLSKIVLSLSVLSSIMPENRLSGITNFIKSFCIWFLGVIFALFSGIQSAIIKISAANDSLIFRGLRFSAAKLVPVAGNMLSESIKTVSASVALINNVCGGFGIAYLIYVSIPVFVSVFIVKFSVLALLLVSKTANLSKHASFFDGVNSAINIILAIVLFSAVCGIIIFSAFISGVV
ncbi:MAG: hypothetical protein IKX77_02720 [Clostridia bacterium]|nr:hypothetical protein [Clostridia bacterium]